MATDVYLRTGVKYSSTEILEYVGWIDRDIRKGETCITFSEDLEPKGPTLMTMEGADLPAPEDMEIDTQVFMIESIRPYWDKGSFHWKKLVIIVEDPYDLKKYFKNILYAEGGVINGKEDV